MSQGLLIESERDQVVLGFSKRGQFLPLTVKWDAAGHPAEPDVEHRHQGDRHPA